MNCIRVLLLVMGLGLISACNTISGAGEDIESGGRAVSDSADSTQKAITQ